MLTIFYSVRCARREFLKILYSVAHPQLVLFTDCVMNSTMKKTTESVMRIKTKELKNCTKTMAVELQTQTV